MIHLSNKIIQYPYQYIILEKPSPSGTEILNIFLAYHPSSKIILSQESPFRIQCPQCHMIYDDRWIRSNIGDVLPKLLVNGWKEIKRGYTHEEV